MRLQLCLMNCQARSDEAEAEHELERLGGRHEARLGQSERVALQTEPIGGVKARVADRLDEAREQRRRVVGAIDADGALVELDPVACGQDA